MADAPLIDLTAVLQAGRGTAAPFMSTDDENCSRRILVLSADTHVRLSGLAATWISLLLRRALR